MSAPPTIEPTARWGDARWTVRRSLALALDGDDAVVLEVRGALTRTRWRLGDGALVSRDELGPWAQPRRVALSRDGSCVVRCDPDGRVTVWDGALPPRAFTLPRAAVPAALSDDGRRLAAWRSEEDRGAPFPRDLDLVDLARGAVEATLQGAHYAAWSPGGDVLVTDGGGGPRLWPPVGSDERGGRVQDAAFLGHDRVVTLGWGGDLSTHRRAAGGLALMANTPAPVGSGFHERIVHADERTLIVADYPLRGRRAGLWAVNPADGAWRRLGEVAGPHTLAASDGARVIAVDRGELVCWDVATGAEARWHAGFGGPVAALAARGPCVAAHDGERDLRVFEADDLAERWALEPTSGRPRARPGALCVSRDARSLFTVNAAEGLVRWDLTTGSVAGTGPRARNAPLQLAALAAGDALLARFAAAPGAVALRSITVPHGGRRRRQRAPRGDGRACLDVRVDAEGAVLALWSDPCQRERCDAETGAAVTRGAALPGRGVSGALALDGGFAAVFAGQGGAEPSVAWMPAWGHDVAHLGVRNAEARVVFAGESLVVCDGEDWGLWRRDGVAMGRAAHLDAGGCEATALAYDDDTGRLVVGTAEGTVVTFALG